MIYEMFHILNCGFEIKQAMQVEHDIMNYQNRGLCYLPKPKAVNPLSSPIAIIKIG